MEGNRAPFLFVGNRLCLDFINTEKISGGQRTSLIQDFADLAAWLLAAGVAREAEIDRLVVHWTVEDKEQFTRPALAFRSTLRGMAAQLVAGETVSDKAIAAINHWLAQRNGHPVLERTEAGYAATVRYAPGAGGMFAEIAESATELLVHADLRLVRKCENPQCILYFYDTSKNHGRRWCSMEGCGNRLKVAAHYQRIRQERTSGSG